MSTLATSSNLGKEEDNVIPSVLTLGSRQQAWIAGISTAEAKAASCSWDARCHHQMSNLRVRTRRDASENMRDYEICMGEIVVAL